jgi:hypothetical protein
MTYFTLRYRDLWSGDFAESRVAAENLTEAIEKLYKSHSDTLAASGKDAPKLVAFDDGNVDLGIPEHVNNAWHHPDDDSETCVRSKVEATPRRRNSLIPESEL